MTEAELERFKVEMFLEREGALDKFITNAKSHWKSDLPIAYDEGAFGISFLFVWKETPEGIRYWRKLCDMYDSEEGEL